jgi:hypothetical protein
MKYPHDYIDYIRYYTNDIMSKSHINKKYKKISLLCFDYLMEIINLTEKYTFDNIWKCDKFASNEPFMRFITQLRIENAQTESPSSLITAYEVGVIIGVENEQRCKTKKSINELEQTVILFILQNQEVN